MSRIPSLVSNYDIILQIFIFICSLPFLIPIYFLKIYPIELRNSLLAISLLIFTINKVVEYVITYFLNIIYYYQNKNKTVSTIVLVLLNPFNNIPIIYIKALMCIIDMIIGIYYIFVNTNFSDNSLNELYMIISIFQNIETVLIIIAIIVILKILSRTEKITLNTIIYAINLVFPVTSNLRNSDICPICHQPNSNNMRILPCQESHQFHTQCINPWLEHHESCIICHQEFSQLENIEIN